MSPLIEDQPSVGKTLSKSAGAKLLTLIGLIILSAVLFFYYDSFAASNFYGGNAQAALEPTKRALFIQELLMGKEHPETANTRKNLARVYDSLGDTAQAEPLYQEAIATYEKKVGKNAYDYGVAITFYGDHLAQMNKHAEALAKFQEALSVLEKTKGPQDIEYAWTLQRIARAYRWMNKNEDADKADAQAKEILAKARR